MKKIVLWMCILSICTLFVGCGANNTPREIKELTPLPKETVTSSDRDSLYEAFLQNELRVANPYVEGTYLTVMDDEDYESEFENAEKKYAFVDVNNDDKPELIFKISSYPSELMYILGICNNKLICFDVFETHTNSISFGIYDYGFVWKCENYEEFSMTYYSYNAEGQPSQARRFTKENEADIAAHEGEEPQWIDWKLSAKNDDDLLEQFLAGEINAEGNGLYGDNSFHISDLPMGEEEWDSYHIGNKIDLDNDGESELILDGPYGGMYLDSSNGNVKVFAIGDGNANSLSYTNCDNEIWILHYDVTHMGRLYYRLDKYSSADTIIETVTLELHEENENIQYYHNGTEVSETEFNELYQKMGIG